MWNHLAQLDTLAKAIYWLENRFRFWVFNFNLAK